MPKALPEIEYINENNSPTLDSKNSFYKIPYYKDTEYFNNYESYVNFVKGCEKAVRNNDRYKKYIAYLKGEVKLNKCQVLKDVTDDVASIELHHGPLFTLFEICEIVLEYFIMKKWKISTFKIAEVVLDEHLKNRVNCVMVSTTVHELIHTKDIFIPYKMAFGNTEAFIKKYRDAISNEIRQKINDYIDRSLLKEPDEMGILKLNSDLMK